MMKAHFNNILVATDFLEQSQIVLEQSFNLAQKFNSNITLLHVIHETKGPSIFNLFSQEQSDKIREEYEEKCRLKLEEIAKEAAKKSGLKIIPMLAKGRIYRRIVEVSELINAKFIVIGTNGKPFDDKYKSVVGSNAIRVVRESKCPVITFNGKDFKSGCDTIILPLDLSKETRQKVTKALEIAKAYNATIKVVSALLTDDKDIINHLMAQIKQVKHFIEEEKIKCTAEFVHGEKGKDKLSDLILKYAKDNKGDLIIIMTQQEVDWTHLFVGSTAQGIINNSDMPVMSIIPKIDEKASIKPF